MPSIPYMIKRKPETVQVDGRPMEARVQSVEEVYDEEGGRYCEPTVLVEDDPRVRVGRSIIVRGHNLRIASLERLSSGIKLRTGTAHVD